MRRFVLGLTWGILGLALGAGLTLGGYRVGVHQGNQARAEVRSRPAATGSEPGPDRRTSPGAPGEPEGRSPNATGLDPVEDDADSAVGSSADSIATVSGSAPSSEDSASDDGSDDGSDNSGPGSDEASDNSGPGSDDPGSRGSGDSGSSGSGGG